MPSAKLERATVRLITGESGLPTLIEGFAPTDTSPSTGPTITAAIENMQLRHVTLYGELLGLRGIRALDVSIDGELFATPDIEVNIKRTSARLVEPFPFEGSIEGLTGSISTIPHRGVELHAKLSRGAEHATASVEYKTPLGQALDLLDLQIHVDPIRSETLRDVGYAWAEPLASSITGDFRLLGPTTDLALTAQLATDGGPLSIDGFIADQRGVSISVRAHDLFVQKVVPKSPELRVSGLARIDIVDGQTEPALHLELEPLLYERVAVPAFELDGKLAEDGVRIDTIRATHVPGGLSGSGHVDWNGRVRARVRGYFPDLARDANIRRFVPDITGSLRAEVDLDFDPDRERYIDWRGRLVLKDVKYGALSAKEVELAGYARGDRDLPRLNLTAHGVEVRAEGYLLGNTDLTVKGAPAEYLATGDFQRDGQRTFHLNARVQANRERVIVNADQIELAVGEDTWRGAIQQLELVAGKSIAVEMFRLASRSQRLEAHGIVRFRGDDEIDAQLQGFDVAALRAIFGKTTYLQAGFLDTNLQLRGDIRQPKLLVQGAITAATIKRIENINGLYFLTYDNGALQVDSEAALDQAGTWTISGTGALDTNISNPVEALRAGRYELSVSAGEAQLPALADLFDVTLPVQQAVMSGTLLAQGTLADPTLDIDLELSEVLVEGLREVAAQVSASYAGGNASITAHVRDERGEVALVEASAPINWGDLLVNSTAVARGVGRSAWRLRLSVPPRALHHFPVVLAPDDRLPITLGLEFRASRLRGRPDANLTLQAGWFGDLPPSGCNASPIPTATVTATLAGDTVGLLSHLGFNDQQLVTAHANFRWPIAEWLDGNAMPLPFDLTGEVRSAINALERVPYVCDHASGRMFLTATMQHLWTDDPDVQIELRSQAKISAERKRRRRSVLVPSCPDEPLSVQAQIGADDEWATANAEIGGCGGGTMQLTAKSPIAWLARGLIPGWDLDRALEARATFAGVQLKPLLDRIPGVFSAAARMDGSITISGTPNAPTFDGSVDLHDGSLRLITTGQNLSQLAGRVVLHRNWLEVQELHARDERGTLRLSGGIGLDGWRPRRLRLAVTTKAFPLRREGAEMASVTAEALLQATIAPDQIGMDLGFASLAIRLPDDAGRSLQPLDDHPDLNVVGRTRPKLLSTKRDIGIRVHSARPFWVRRSDFSALVDSDLNIAYSAAEVAVGGYVEFNRGVFDVFGKSFNLERGSIRFDGSGNLNPELNLIAVHDPQVAGSSPVRVVVTGRMSAPEVEFSAQGCDDESGALSLLLTGKCSLSETSGPDNNPDAQRAAFVGGLLAGVLTLGAKSELGALIPVIGMESTGEGFNQRIRAGIDADTLVPKFLRSIVRRAYVEGAVTTGSENQDGSTGPASVDFLLELYLPHNIVGAGRVTPGNNQVQWGVDVTWEP